MHRYTYCCPQQHTHAGVCTQAAQAQSLPHGMRLQIRMCVQTALCPPRMWTHLTCSVHTHTAGVPVGVHGLPCPHTSSAFTHPSCTDTCAHSAAMDGAHSSGLVGAHLRAPAWDSCTNTDTRAWNHRRVWVGTLKVTESNAPCSKQGHLRLAQAAQSLIHSTHRYFTPYKDPLHTRAIRTASS